jgi:hypothetical protein
MSAAEISSRNNAEMGTKQSWSISEHYNRYREFKSFVRCRICTFPSSVRLFKIS